MVPDDLRLVGNWAGTAHKHAHTRLDDLVGSSQQVKGLRLGQLNWRKRRQSERERWRRGGDGGGGARGAGQGQEAGVRHDERGREERERA